MRADLGAHSSSSASLVGLERFPATIVRTYTTELSLLEPVILALSQNCSCSSRNSKLITPPPDADAPHQSWESELSLRHEVTDKSHSLAIPNPRSFRQIPQSLSLRHPAFASIRGSPTGWVVQKNTLPELSFSLPLQIFATSLHGSCGC